MSKHPKNARITPAQARALHQGRALRWPVQTIAERFWSKVLVIDDDDSCWEWQGALAGKPGNQYGQIRIDGRSIKAHRLSWEIAHGPIPGKLWVLHTCDNGPCVRPEHLFLGTRKDNIRDMWEKGRGVTPPLPSAEQRATGSRIWNSVLVEEDIPIIRALLADGIKRAEIARRFNCDWCTIDHIYSGRTWKHVE